MYNYIEKSTSIKHGMRKSFADTNSKMANRICYGYTKLPNGELTVNEQEAEVVRLIFSLYNSGKSLGKITKLLEQKQILSPAGKPKWNKEALNKLISNEKYTGEVLLQKTESFCGVQFKNDSELQKILITNHHVAIISDQVFDAAQKLKLQRAK